jgi:radical SAM superfamily enzyme YgiQ (UPF0313 family)
MSKAERRQPSPIISLEHGVAISEPSENPFTTETPLYVHEQKSGDILVTVVVPDFYHIALPNLGHQMVEHQLNEQTGFHADRAYLNRDYSLLKKETQSRPEIIFISMSYEGSYIRALRMLDQMGCPLRRQDRTPNDPLVVIGGWSVARNPLPLFEIADVIGIGDSQKMIAALSDCYRMNRQSRSDLYDQIVTIEGIILPDRYQVATTNGYLDHWEAHQAPTEIFSSRSSSFPHSWYLSPETDYNRIGYYDRNTFFSMEIIDHCRSKCGFCASGFDEGGFDIQDPKALGELATWASSQGADLVKLFFPANSSVEVTKAIMKEMMARNLPPRVGSAKAEYIDLEYLQLVGKSGQEKIAFAPETGDYELRRVIGKPGMTDQVLQNVISASIQSGIPNLDLYLIMNLPGEGPEAHQKMVDLLGGFYDLAQREGIKGQIRMSAPNFFPKSHTPFQYARSGEINVYEERMAKLAQDLEGKIAVSSMSGSVDLLSQNIMSRGGIEAGQLMMEVYRHLKMVEQATGQFQADTFEDWRLAMANLNIDERAYFDDKDTSKLLPWHHIHFNKKSNLGTDNLIRAWEVFKAKRVAFMVD